MVSCGNGDASVEDTGGPPTINAVTRRRAEAKRAFEAMMSMKKIDVAAIEAARRG